MSDHELLQAYARDRSQTAFATLVQRHLDLVYSAALRQVRAHRAEEVAQSVFIDLARRASTIAPSQPLAAWLYVVTRRTALNAIREESRRRARETAAAEIAAMKTPSPGWSKIADSLDEAMETLNETERTAVVLRFFQNLSLREVGAALGVSEDTAQKRVSRALERLRTAFGRRGVAVTAAGLATDLSAHTLQIAPAGLGTAIAQAATLTTATTAVAFETTRLIVMTTAQKYLVAAAFVVAGGVGVYESTLASRWRAERENLLTENVRAIANLAALRSTHDAATARLHAVESEIDARLSRGTPSTQSEVALVAKMDEWLSRVDRVRQFIAQRPELNVPELKMLTERQWLGALASQPSDSEQALRAAAAALRRMAENRITPDLSEALRAYLKAHNNTLPNHPRDLAPYFASVIDPAILDRYQLSHTGKLSDVPPEEHRKLLTLRNPADAELDVVWMVGPRSHGNMSAMGVNLQEAMRRFAAANGGGRPATAAQLRSYLQWPVRDEAVQNLLDRVNAAGYAP